MFPTWTWLPKYMAARTEPPHRELRHSSSEPTFYLRQVWTGGWFFHHGTMGWMGWRLILHRLYIYMYIIIIVYIYSLYLDFWLNFTKYLFHKALKPESKLYQSVLRNGYQLRGMWKDVNSASFQKQNANFIKFLVTNEAGDKPCDFCAATESWVQISMNIRKSKLIKLPSMTHIDRADSRNILISVEICRCCSSIKHQHI